MEGFVEKSRLLSGIARISKIWAEKSTHGDNDDCNDIHDSNAGNFDDNDEEMTNRHTNIVTFQQKCTLIW